MDAVSDRDFLVEYLAGAALVGVHLSRLAEDLILFSSAEFGFVRFGEAFTTGSSLMPQKRNPDMAELVRGKSGRLTGHLVALLTVLKGLPLTYNRDLQEDKECVFDAADTVRASLEVMAHAVASLEVDGAACLYAGFCSRAFGDGCGGCVGAGWVALSEGSSGRGGGGTASGGGGDAD